MPHSRSGAQTEPYGQRGGVPEAPSPGWQVGAASASPGRAGAMLGPPGGCPACPGSCCPRRPSPPRPNPTPDPPTRHLQSLGAATAHPRGRLLPRRPPPPLVITPAGRASTHTSFRSYRVTSMPNAASFPPRARSTSRASPVSTPMLSRGCATGLSQLGEQQHPRCRESLPVPGCPGWRGRYDRPARFVTTSASRDLLTPLYHTREVRVWFGSFTTRNPAEEPVR